MKKVVIAGGGVLGSQIAFQCAYCGYDTTIWLRSEDSIKRTKPKIDKLKDNYKDAIKLMDTPEGKNMNNWCRGIVGENEFNAKECLKKVDAAYKNLKLETDVDKVFSDADIVIESVVEDLNEKKNFYAMIRDVLPEKTLLLTNSSTLLPSKMASSTGRENKYLALHFANSIWKNNTAEVMAQSKTDMKYFDETLKFAKTINMIGLPVKKEKSGYLLNSMLVPFLFSAMDLIVNGVSDPESIDKAWTLGTGAPNGPFQILDTVGLITAHNIIKMYLKVPSFLAPYNFKGMDKLLREYIDAGKLGKSTGEGFYKY